MSYSDRIWQAARFIPVMFLGWHALLAMIGAPWIVEIPWLMVYGVALWVLQSPRPVGYFYLILLIVANWGWEIWIGYLLLDEVRIVVHFLPGLALIYLYMNRYRFEVARGYGLIAIIALGLLIVETGYLGVKSGQYKASGEYGQWSVSDTGRDALGDEIAWCGRDKIVTVFIKSRRDGVYFVGELNRTTGELRQIDSPGRHPSASSDGQWVSYMRDLGWSGKKHFWEYVRYHVPTGKKETILRYNDRYTDDPLLAPNGDRLLVNERAGEPAELLHTSEPQWELLRWHDKFRGVWMPDGSKVLAHRAGSPFIKICSSDGQSLQEIRLPNVEFYDFKVGPDGRYIYLKSIHGKMYYYDLMTPLNGWRTVSGIVESYVVGTNGILVYSGILDLPDVYTYLK